MLSESQVRDRAVYCCCVFLQLSWLYANDEIEPSRYLERLESSSLQLATDQFLVMTIQDALAEGRPDAGLLSLMALYEGFAHAFCEVLETTMGEVEKDLPPDLLQKLASEMGVNLDVD